MLQQHWEGGKKIFLHFSKFLNFQIQLFPLFHFYFILKWHLEMPPFCPHPLLTPSVNLFLNFFPFSFPPTRISSWSWKNWLHRGKCCLTKIKQSFATILSRSRFHINKKTQHTLTVTFTDAIIRWVHSFVHSFTTRPPSCWMASFKAVFWATSKHEEQTTKDSYSTLQRTSKREML